MGKQVNCERCYRISHKFFPAVLRCADGEALCLPCIRAEDIDPDECTAIEEAAAPQAVKEVPEVLTQQQEASVPNFKCACGCGREVAAEGKRLRGHWQKTGGKKRGPKPKKPVVVEPESVEPKSVAEEPAVVEATAEVPRVTLQMNVSEAWLNLAWGRLDLDQKARAIAHALQE